jgi:hypothetical protein
MDFSVYFIQAGNGPVKIGVTSRIDRRLGLLQVGNAELLTVRRLVPGSWREEAMFHWAFRDVHIRGEWFRPTPTMARLMNTGEGVEEIERDWLHSMGEQLPGEFTGTDQIPVCRQCGINLNATQRVGDLCAACDEFADLRETAIDPFELSVRAPR